MTGATGSENKSVESRDTTNADNKNSSRTMRRFVINTNNKENDINSTSEGHYSATMALLPTAEKCIELTKMENLPSFTTWIPLDRNRRMTEDQSVVGRKQIYYDQRGGEALIDSDSDKEVINEEEEKKEFTICEDEILRENVLALEADKGVDPLAENCAEGDGQKTGTQLGGKSRFARKRGKVRCSKYTTKSSGYSSVRSRISVKKDELNHHYEPCGCKSACGKDCLCLLNRTHCEKYCGCPRSCKNRFRGCRCSKRQCRTHQCSCVAASRECDPDVCSDCFISCGDGICGAPPQKEKSYNCMNMRLLQNQHQKVLIGRSDVSGWGAFIKNACEKDECIGEYRGELISHCEAGKRGKIYDRMNSSYLFDLNNQYVLDALRMGNKLRFANHSSSPNCYPKILFVAGDHRVGIFASEKLSAGQELFLDYGYKKDVAPQWVKDHKASGSKEDEGVYRAERKALGSKEDEGYTPSRSRVKMKASGSKKGADYALH